MPPTASPKSPTVPQQRSSIASGWNDPDTGENVGLMTSVENAICGTSSDRQGVHVGLTAFINVSGATCLSG
jgi:hypothetical protein